ncbi:MAG: S53 family peptidase [Gaiellaceae bacterium]
MRHRKLGLLLGLGVVAAAVLTAGASAGNTTSGGGVPYNVNPSYVFGFAAPSSSAKFPTPSQCIASDGLSCYTPSEIRTAYDVPKSATGAGQTIVIVDAYGSPTIRQDLATFDSEFGLPAPTLNILYPGGSPTFNPLQSHAEANWAFETSLDVEWSHAIAPLATIDLVIGANNDGNVLNNAAQYAVSNHLGNVMSLSYGFPEGVANGNSGQISQSHAIFQAAQAEKMSVFVSSGDFGANNQLSFVNASYPASDPLVTSVGGTNLFISDTGSYQSETVWNDTDPALCPFGCTSGVFGATGGAPSLFFSGRSTSDVGYNASVYTGVMTYISFPGVSPGFYFTGGTSEGAPQWAGITADADQAAGHALGFLDPALFAAPSVDFHDVTVGENGFFGPGEQAGPGYDMPTGLGTPDVAKLIKTLAR